VRPNDDVLPTSLLVEAEESKIPEIKDKLTHFYAENIEHRRWGAPLYFQHKNESIYLLFLGFYFLQLLLTVM
jgi:hypothetical protein